MRASRLVLALVLLVPAVAVAQTTSDGVDAFNRGDYPRAAQILKSIAERWVGTDDVSALFHMATLYQKGLGVPVDPLRACVLFARAALPNSITPNSITASRLMQQAQEQLHQTQTTMNSEQFKECLLIARLGFDHGFQPATFALGPGDWIGLDLSPDKQGISVIISRDGKDTHKDVGVTNLSGTRFLPFEHTELMTGRTRTTPRNFIESFTWFPSLSGQWSLGWHLFEVLQDDLVHVAAGLVSTLSAEQPPTELSHELRDAVRLRVNDGGDVEWETLGPTPQHGVIETDAERREVNELNRRRREADEQVDWAQVRDRHETPTLAYADADGCGNLFVYGWSSDRTEAMTILVDREPLALSTAPRTFDLRRQRAIAIEVHVFERAERNWPFCTDVIIREGHRRDTWQATAGVVTIELSSPGIRAQMPLAYRATIRITGAEFVSATGVRVKQVKPIVLTAIVGRLS